MLAVGTTTVRVLETVAHGGPLAGRTELFITPGFEFRRAATYTHYPCSDGAYIAIAANDQAMWERMCDAVCPALKTDPRFAGPS